jgi:translation elongation factor EF-G
MLDFDARGGFCSVHALIRLAAILGYARDLDRMTTGAGSLHLELDHFAPVRSS